MVDGTFGDRWKLWSAGWVEGKGRNTRERVEWRQKEIPSAAEKERDPIP